MQSKWAGILPQPHLDLAGRWFLPGRWQCIARGSVGSPPLIGSYGQRPTAVAIRRCGQVVGLAEWHMLPSWLPPTYVPECLLLACWGLGLATLWPLCSSQLRRPVTDVEPQRRFGPLRRILAVRIGSPRRISDCADRQQRALRLQWSHRRLSLPSHWTGSAGILT